jgi:hypothetical protein
MTQAQILAELERQMGPLDERAKKVAARTLALLETRATGEETSDLSEPEGAFQGENPPFAEIARLGLTERGRVMQALASTNRAWLQQKCAELQARWLIVVDGQILAHGPTLASGTVEQAVQAAARETGKFPLLFVAPWPIEEKASWHATRANGLRYRMLPRHLNERSWRRDLCPSNPHRTCVRGRPQGATLQDVTVLPGRAFVA